MHGDPTMDPYTILSLPPTATDAEIKKAFRTQMLQLNPDRLSPTLADESIAAVRETFHNVKDAYEFLISPIHVTSKRLYMAKMASQRADYERREAYLRRSGDKGDNYTAYIARGGAGGGVSGYRSGVGGAAGMAGTAMPQRKSDGVGSGNKNGDVSSYPVPPKIKMNRSKRKGDFQGEQRDDRRHERDHHCGGGQRRSGVGGMHKNARMRSNSGGENKGGHKRDAAGYVKTKPNTTRKGQIHNLRGKNKTVSNARQQHGQRTKYVRRRPEQSEGKTSSTKENRKSRTNHHRLDVTTGKSQDRKRLCAESNGARLAKRRKPASSEKQVIEIQNLLESLNYLGK